MTPAKIEPIIRHILYVLETVQDRTLMLFARRKSHTGFPLVPKVVTSNDLERRNGRYFALFHRIRLLCEPITSQWLKVDPYCLQQKA